MMRLVIVGILLSLSFSAQADVSVGKVNLQQVLLSTKEGKQIRERLKKKFDEKQEELKKEEKKIRDLQEKYKKQSVVLSDKAKAKKMQELQQKQMTLQQKAQRYQQEMQELEQKYRQPVMEKLKGIIETVSKKEKVDITFEQSTAPILYAKDVKDLTEQVIKLYDKKHSK